MPVVLAPKIKVLEMLEHKELPLREARILVELPYKKRTP